MTTIQEAYVLIQNQSESNLRTIVELLRKMPTNIPRTKKQPRTGLGKHAHHLPASFDSDFNSLDSEIASNFYENEGL